MEDQESSPNKNSRLYIYLGVAIFAVVSMFSFSSYMENRGQSQDIGKVLPSDMKVQMQSITKSSSVEKIAVITVSGIIGTPGLKEKVIAELRSASQNAEVKAVILRVESPGGGVHETALIYREVLKFKESKKPLVAFFNGIAASGGYYISAPADKIMATPETVTGSIGVIVQFPDYSGLMSKLGLKMHTVKTGAQKDMLSPYRDVDPEGEKILRDWVNESYEEFVRVVSVGRKMNEKTVRNLADGRIYSGRQAAKNKLVDSTGYFEDAVALAKELAKSPDASVVEMNAVDTSMRALLGNFKAAFQKERTPLEKIMEPSGFGYIAPEFAEKYRKP